MSTFLRSLASIVLGAMLGMCGLSAQAAPPVKVELATPGSAEQDTVDLDVVITGSGFEPGAVVDFFVTGGETDKGNVVVTQVTYHDSKKLTAKVSLTNAKIADFDVKVTLMSGRNGKGITLFKVVAKSSARAGDTTPPAVISDLRAIPTIFALGLRFTETGDDGTVGTASGYDVRYRGDTGGGCADDPASWTVASRSSTTIPYGAGQFGAFNVRPLTAGASYCVAIRVRDEVPNWSAWARASVATLSGSGWAHIGYPSSSSPTYFIGNGAIVQGASGLAEGWQSTLYPSGNLARVVLTGSGWQYELDVSSLIDNNAYAKVAFAPIPYASASPISALVAGTGGTGVRYVIVEGAGPTSAPAAAIVASRSGKLTAGGLDENPDSPLAYVPRSDRSGYDPVILLDRVEAKTNSYKRTALRVAQRNPSGGWAETPILWREGSGITVNSGYFDGGQFVVKPSGALGVLVADCGINVYAERDPTSGAWSYFDVGPSQYGAVPTVDSLGGVVLASRRDDANGIPSVMRILRQSEGDFVALSGPPAASCSSVPPTRVAASAWEEIDTGAGDEFAGYSWDPRGISDVGGATFIATARSGQHRIVYRCSAAGPWNVERIDATSGRGMLQPALDAAGNTLKGYSWGYYGTANGPWIDQAYLAQDVGNACGVVP